MKRLFTSIFFLISIITYAQQEGIHFVHNSSWQQVLERAKKESKFILLDAYASWCGPCKWMAKEIFPKPEVGEAINPAYISAEFDMEKGEGLDLAKKYEVRNYPTYLFFDQDGNLVHRSLGSMSAEDFIKVCKDALDSTKQYVTLRKKYLKGQRDSSFLREFAFVAENAQDSLSKISMLKYFQANHNELNCNTIQFLFALTSSLKDTSFNILLNNKEEFYKIIGKEEVDATIEELVWNEAKKAGKKGTEPEAFKKVIQQYLPEKTDLLYAEYELSLLKRSNNWKAYLPKAEQFAATYCQNDYDRLNTIANNLFDNFNDKTTLQKGLKMALRSIVIKADYENYAIAAHIYLKLGDRKNAKIAAEKSLDLSKKEGVESFDIEQLLKSLK